MDTIYITFSSIIILFTTYDMVSLLLNINNNQSNATLIYVYVYYDCLIYIGAQ